MHDDTAADDNNNDNGDSGGEKQQSAKRGRGGGRLQVQKEAVVAVEKRGWLSHTTISHKKGGTRWKQWCWGQDLRTMMEGTTTIQDRWQQGRHFDGSGAEGGTRGGEDGTED